MYSVLILLVGLPLIFGQYEVPDATVEIFSPKGFRVSIPDEEGIKLFAFHGKVNEEFNGREAGSWARDITKAKNGRWTFSDPSYRFKQGDILYYWTYVDYFDGERKLGYVKEDQEFEVKSFLPSPTGTTRRPQVATTKTTTTRPTDECQPSITQVKNKAICGGQLIFDEDFSTFRTNFWTPEIRFAQAPDYEFTLYHKRSEVLSIGDGRLQISPKLTENLFTSITDPNGLDLNAICTGAVGSLECIQRPDAYFILPPVTSASVTTKQKFSFTYGLIEIRAKLPKGEWLYPELYLNPSEHKYGHHYESGQIRIAFAPGNADSANKLYGGCILGSSSAARNSLLGNSISNQKWGNEFHKYWVKWTDQSIVVGVDDVIYNTIFPPDGGFADLQSSLDLKNSERWKSGSKMAPFDASMYLSIGVGVGGHSFEDRADDSKPWINNDPKNQLKFYKAKSNWYPSWNNESSLIIDKIQIFAI